MKRVAGYAFISYVREDSLHVDRLQRLLERAAIPVWRDTEDLWPGQDWRAEIRSAITENSLVFIACFSGNSLERERSYQRDELLLAIDQLRIRRPDVPWLIPVRFDDCSIPAHDIGGGRTLASIQRTDLFGKHSDEGAARLVTTVLRLLDQPSRASSGATARTGGRSSPASVLPSGTISPRGIVGPGDIVCERAEPSAGKRLCIRYSDGAIADLSASSEGRHTEPDVSPVDSTIAFVRGTGIWTVKPDGSEEKLLADFSSFGPSYAPAMPRWSPDGNSLAFELRSGDVYDYQWVDSGWPADLRSLRGGFAQLSGGQSNICVMDINGAGVRQLTNDDISYGPASWSPAGEQLVFAHASGMAWRTLRIIDAEGGESEELGEGVDWSLLDESYPEWSADGMRIYYRFLERRVGAYHLAYGYYESREQFVGRQIATRSELKARPPASDGMSALRISVDGKRILFGYGKVYWAQASGGGLTLLMKGSNPVFVKTGWSNG
jgi:hypothetical protein